LRTRREFLAAEIRAAVRSEVIAGVRVEVGPVLILAEAVPAWAPWRRPISGRIRRRRRSVSRRRWWGDNYGGGRQRASDGGANAEAQESSSKRVITSGGDTRDRHQGQARPQ
jgi:hypothetical protein